jgi:hypothetical protein
MITAGQAHYSSYDENCNKLLEEQKVRFAGIIDELVGCHLEDPKMELNLLPMMK